MIVPVGVIWKIRVCWCIIIYYCGYRIMVVRQFSKLSVGVRFPLPAPFYARGEERPFVALAKKGSPRVFIN